MGAGAGGWSPAPRPAELAGAPPPNAHSKHLGEKGLSLMGLELPGDLPISGPRPRVPYVLHRRAAPTGPLSRHLPAHSLCSSSQSGGALQAGMGGGPRPRLAQLWKAPGMPPQNRSSPTPYTSTPLGATPLGGSPPLESVAGHSHRKWSWNLRVPSSQTIPHRCFSHLPLRVMVVWSQPLLLSNQLPFPSLFSQVYLLEGSHQRRRTRGYSTWTFSTSQTPG